MRNLTCLLLILTGFIAQNLSKRCFADEVVEPFAKVDVSDELKNVKLLKVWQHKMQMRFQGKTLREFGYQLERETGLFCWIDTRINPEQEVSFNTNFKSIRGVLDDVCHQQHLSWVECGRGIFLTDEATAKILPMLLEWQRQQLGLVGISSDEKIIWLKDTLVHWPLLSRPVDLCQSLVKERQVKLTGWEKIPHDVLAPGRNAELSQLEQMQTLLVQYGLTWVWKNKNELEIVPIMELGRLSIKYVPDVAKKQVYLDFAKRLVDLEINEQAKTWVVSGTVIQQAEFHYFQRKHLVSREENVASTSKLKNRKFTLRVDNGKVLDILQSFKDSQLNISWDENIFSNNDVKFDIRVSINIKDASLDEMLKQILEPAGLTYSLKDEEITILPNKTRPPSK